MARNSERYRTVFWELRCLMRFRCHNKRPRIRSTFERKGPPPPNIFCKFCIMKGSSEIQTLLPLPSPSPPADLSESHKNRERRWKSPYNLATNRRHLLVEYSNTCFCLILSFHAPFLYLSRLLCLFSVQFTVVQTSWDIHQVFFSLRHVMLLHCRRCKPITHNKHCARLFLSACVFFLFYKAYTVITL
jgi:hypothetical protein